ncbi:nucleic acid-binding protein [Aerococcaceae bacterium DSM 111020]|nr:nucleic acid-binding protein [Aerococcaceae bacterium DSM 111020]
MRMCICCNTKMVENCGIKVKWAGYGIDLTDDENKLYGGRLGEPKMAICPSCGEVSIYLADVEKLKN